MSFPPAPISESVDFLRSILDCQPSQVAVVDREGRVLYANRAWHRFWQSVGETPVAAILETYTDICNPTLGQCSESTATVAQKIRSVFDGESPRETLTYMCERGGQPLWFDASITPITPTGVGVIVTHYDVTEQNHTASELDAAIRKNDAMDRAMDEHSLVSVTDKHGVILSVNSGFCRISGYSREELIGKSHRVVNSGHHSPEFWEEVWLTIQSGRAWRGEVCNRRKDGSLFWVDTTIVPHIGSDGTIERYIALRFEITEGVVSRQRFAEAQALLEQTGRLAKVGGWEVDLSTMTPVWSEEIFRIFAVPSNCQPDLEASIQFYVGKARDQIRHVVEHAIATGEPWDLELPCRDADGNDLWVRTIGVPEMSGGRCVKLWGALQDITEQRLSKLELEKMTRRLARATDGAGVGIWEYRRHCQHLYCDRIVEKQFGIVEQGQTSRFGLWMQALQDEAERMSVMIHEAIDNQSGFSDVFRIALPSGESRYLLISATAECDDDSEVYLVGTSQDVTEKHEAEVRLNAAMSVARVGLWDWNVLADQCFYSETYCEMLGYEPNEIMDKQRKSLAQVHPEDFPQAQLRLHRHLSGTSDFYRSEHRVRKKDGTWNWVQDVGEVVERDSHGNPVRVIGAHIDIQPIKELSSRLELAISSANAGLWDWNVPAGEFVTNEQYHTMLGDPVRTTPVRIREFTQRVHPDDMDSVMKNVAQAHLDDDFKYSIEFRFACHDGHYKWIHSTGRVIERDRDGNPIRMIGQHTDVDAHRQAIVDIENLNKELAEQITVANRLAEKADAANRAKSQFLANMSHEIRTPMTAILGFAESLEESITDANQLQSVETITRNGTHLLALINDILDLSKIEEGCLELEKLEFSPRRLLNDIHDTMLCRAEQKGLQLDLNIKDPMPCKVLSDPTRVKQILINLVGNAIKFTESGSVRLEAKSKWVDGGHELEFTVTDTGIGMSDDQRARLFQPFMQADSSMSRRFGGTGLGLTICQRLAKMLGGSINVQSQPDVGSTFRTTLRVDAVDHARTCQPTNDAGCITCGQWPPNQQTTDPARTKGNQPAADLSGVRCLLVEDGVDNQRLIQFILKKAGAEVVIRENGLEGFKEALHAMQSDAPYSVILMDMQMPVMDGYTATAQLRKSGYTLPVIALTAHAMAGARQQCLSAGCDAYAIKPIKRDALIRLVEFYSRSTVSD